MRKDGTPNHHLSFFADFSLWSNPQSHDFASRTSPFGPIVRRNLPLSKIDCWKLLSARRRWRFPPQKILQLLDFYDPYGTIVIIAWMRASFSGATSPLKQALIVSISAGTTSWGDKISWRSMKLAFHWCQQDKNWTLPIFCMGVGFEPTQFLFWNFPQEFKFWIACGFKHVHVQNDMQSKETLSVDIILTFLCYFIVICELMTLEVLGDCQTFYL